jgi:hypothetical protein
MILDFPPFKPIKEMATYLDSVIPEDKTDLVKNGLNRLLVVIYVVAFLSGVVFELCLLKILKLVGVL